MVEEVKTVESFEKILAENPRVVVDFFADWCGPCKAISPTIDTFSQTYQNVKFIKIDVDSEAMGSIVEKYEVQSMPTFVFIKNGELVETVIGAMKTKIETAVIKLTA